MWAARHLGAEVSSGGDSPLAAINLWAWGGEGRPQPTSGANLGQLVDVHCWQQGDPLIGDPPHKAAG